MSVPPAPPSTTDGRPNQSSPDPSRPRTVLVAEDDDAVRAFVVAVLEQAGFTVVATANGSDAGAIFTADPARFDLVLTDVIMPQALGTDLAAIVRRLRPGLPVLFMSAFPGGAGVAPDPLPADEPLVEKPFTVASLLKAVNDILGH